MLNLEYHKGEPCVYKAVLCQEGYCSECAIYLNNQIKTRPGARSGTKTCRGRKNSSREAIYESSQRDQIAAPPDQSRTRC